MLALIGNGSLHQLFPKIGDGLGRQFLFRSPATGICNNLRLAFLVTHLPTLRLDPGGGAHISKAGFQKRDQCAVGRIDSPPYISHGLAVIGAWRIVHAPPLGRQGEPVEA